MSRLSRLSPARRAAASLACLGATAWPLAGQAQFEFTPHADSQLQYDSNVYRVSSTAAAPIIDGERVRGDGILSTTAGIDTRYLWDEQKLRLEVEGERFDYQRSKALNRFDYQFGGGLDWVALSNLTGELDYRQQRRLASFADRDTSRRLSTRDRLGGGQVNLVVGNDWRLEGGYHIHEFLAPLPDAPDFTLRENTATGAIKYLGVAKIAAGIGGEFVDGSFRGSATPAGNADFTQYSLGATLNYEATGLSAFDLALGYTTRDDPTLAGKSTSFTGKLGYNRQLTGKTRASANLFRRVVSYDAGTNSVVETGGLVKVDWDATARISVGAYYEYTYGRFATSSLAGARDSGRRDRLQSTSLTIDYEVLRWLKLRLYSTYQARTSSVEASGFNDVLGGFEVRLRLEP